MKIDDKTTIPLWSVVVSIPVVVGFISWISFIAHATDLSTDKIKKIEEQQDKHYELLRDIKEDVSIIKKEIKRR